MSDFIGDKQCVTHHYACECREAQFAALKAKLSTECERNWNAEAAKDKEIALLREAAEGVLDFYNYEKEQGYDPATQIHPIRKLELALGKE